MSYLLKSRRERGNNKFLKVVLIILSILLIFSFIFPKTIKFISSKIFYPFISARDNIFLSNSVISFFDAKADLKAENDRLREENSTLLARLSKVSKIEEENASLRETLNANNKREVVFAEVLSSPPVSFYDSLVIKNPGKQIKLGSEVLAYGEVVIGEISDVTQSNALVRLYSSPGNYFQGVFGNNDESFEVVGMGGGFFKVKVPKSINVTIGENVYFKGTTKLVGVIKRAEENPSDSFKEVFIQSPVNVFRLKSVAVVI